MLTRILLASSLVFSLTACETAEDNATERARSCIDAAMKLSLTNPATAATNAVTCETYVANTSTAEAGKVAFMATLIQQQKISQLAQAATALNATSSTLGTSMSYLAYNSTASATRMWNYASLSGSAGILKLAALIQVATIANSLASITVGNNSSVAAAIGQIISTGSAQQQQEAATAILTLQQSVCDGSGADTTTCNKVNTAIGSATTPAAILANVQAAIAGGI